MNGTRRAGRDLSALVSAVYAAAMGDTEPIWLLEHRRSTAAEGRKAIWQACIAAILLVILLPLLWPEGEWFHLSVVAFVMFVSVAVGLHFGRVNIRAAGTFICRLSRERLECHSPVPQCGESFSIAISEIDRLEISRASEGANSLCIWSKSGRRFRLTYNYKNPADRFFDMIQELDPNIEVRST